MILRMPRRYPSTVRVLTLAAGIATAATVAAGPAQADPTTDAFLAALGNAGIAPADPANAVAVGQSVCPMLSEPGQTTADVAGKVADMAGMSLGPATMFTGLAISMFCPAAVGSIGNGISPIPLPFGF
jgi:hypothetical protein